jgi:hypothetical protein
MPRESYAEVVRYVAVLAVGAFALAAAPAGAQDPSDPGCVGDTEAEGVVQKPGPALRMGVTPGVQTGQLGTGATPPRTPEDPARHLAALNRLRPRSSPLVLRLHRFFWSDGEAGIRRFLALADRYTREGFLVELQLRYHPNEQQEGDIAAWTAHVRDVVRRFGPNRRVVAIQVTNEVNLTFSPDSSDGAYEGARDALVQGVIAAKDEARRRGFGHLEIGFNWAYRLDPAQEQSFWNGVRDRGGRRFVESLDWVGLDAYPGTFFPPAEAPGEERDGMVNAMSALRCYLKTPGVPERVPIHVEENGYPTGPGRSEERQAQAAETLIRAVHDFRGTYNVSDYRWFNLRDGDSQSGNFQTQYGLLRDDYSEKPAFAVVARLFDALAIRVVEPPIGRERILRVRVTQACRSRGRVKVRVSSPTHRIARVAFASRGRRAHVQRHPPYGRVVRPDRRGRIALRLAFRDRAPVRIVRRARRCARRR